MTGFESPVPILIKALHSLDRCLAKGRAYAEARKFDPDVLVTARLAPDQFALVRQVQSACDTAKFAAAKLSGQPPPVHPDTEKTLAELSARIHTCIAYLETFKVSDFVGAETRACSHVWMQGKHVTGRDYVSHYVLPNFYFHMVTAYAILRHNGVDVGKLDYLGELPMVG